MLPAWQNCAIIKREMKINLLFVIGKIVRLKMVLSKVKSSVFLGLVLAALQIQCVNKPVEVSRDPSSEGQVILARPLFQQCSHKKMYLENEMATMPSEYFRWHVNEYEKSIPVSCIQFAQKNFTGHYGVCNEEETQPLISELKPCLTEKYVALTYNSFHDVMDCFNLDPRDFYLQVMIESGFHINAINKTGMDSGMTQFTANGIKKVTANNLVEKVRRVLLESSRPSCQRISSIVGAFDIEAFSVSKRCALISLPKNPYRSMLFAYLHTLIDQILLDEVLSDLTAIQPALTSKIKRQLIFLSYNRGLTGLRRLLKGYIESRNYFSYVITEADLDLNKNLSRVKSILLLEPEKKEQLRRSKVRNLSFAEYALINGASYVSDMAAASDYVQRNLGNSCGEL